LINLARFLGLGDQGCAGRDCIDLVVRVNSRIMTEAHGMEFHKHSISVL